MLEWLQIEGLPHEPLFESLLTLHLQVFTDQSREEAVADMTYHAQRGPLLTLLAMDSGVVVGYKMGYERKPAQFYSWLGCVSPDYRGRGIAAELMTRQHDWCRQCGYQTIRTQTMNRWRTMLLLNIRHGFDIIGTLQGHRGLIIVLEKRLV
ncbi:hypothetical protein GCM10023189_05090 [Nibrella saemangeumensis]|uniref:N-acetyltransferase domain-containing protein n=2 Tax=Nibrella saemangeumensis TaxID=1084526 RepID=A0ABP8ME53_9BACT